MEKPSTNDNEHYMCFLFKIVCVNLLIIPPPPPPRKKSVIPSLTSEILGTRDTVYEEISSGIPGPLYRIVAIAPVDCPLELALK